jgi:hypothetical protein
MKHPDEASYGWWRVRNTDEGTPAPLGAIVEVRLTATDLVRHDDPAGLALEELDDRPRVGRRLEDDLVGRSERSGERLGSPARR